MPFGNVNVDYVPCKTVGQLKSAALYMLGMKPEQRREGIVKTRDDLYAALGCNRNNFANDILITRKLNGKSYSKHKPDTILAHKMSISFHPNDNGKLDHKLAFKIAQEFAEHFIHSKGYEVLFAVHTDTEHIHAHFLISNCNMETGKSYRRSQHDLYEMSEYFGQQCRHYGLTNSIRDNFYNRNLDTARDKETFAETQMKKRGAETFKDELREVIREEIADPNNRTFEDVINALEKHYGVECRVAGNTVSYRHPLYKDKNGKLVSVRGSKLGELYTRKGIENEIAKNRSGHTQAVDIGSDTHYIGGAEITGDRTAAACGNGTGGLPFGSGQNVGRASSPVTAEPYGRRNEVSLNADNRNGQRTERNLSEFFERYKRTNGEDEQQPAPAHQRTGTVRKKRSR
ncbi:MAG: relaxase/mobilization nuclease domain-containing protein [Ruminiclostridium sp.]|nr:relaxase/mobilization nuclease domain-containing protein [Ruminiclostridium sp.]